MRQRGLAAVLRSIIDPDLWLAFARDIPGYFPSRKGKRGAFAQQLADAASSGDMSKVNRWKLLGLDKGYTQVGNVTVRRE